MKLAIDLVPSSSWYDNMRKAVDKITWDRIRKKAYASSNHKCGICGSAGKLNCHEIWKYDDKKHIQKLKGFVALCDMCHHVKHIGFAGILASEGKLDYELVVRHFMKVNKCDRKEFERHKDEAFAVWENRSRHEWKVEWEEIAKKQCEVSPEQKSLEVF